jgi:hypothetical protein
MLIGKAELTRLLGLSEIRWEDAIEMNVKVGFGQKAK